VTDLPIPSPSASPVATLDPTEAAIDRFLARVRALTPRQWGELDAVAQRLLAGDLVSRWRAARRATAGADNPVLRDLLSITEVVIGTAVQAASSVLGARRSGAPGEGGGGSRFARATLSVLRPTGRPSKRSDLLVRASRELTDLAEVQPGGPGDATVCLHQALIAVWRRPMLSSTAFAEMYAPVEPFIPAASL
jgi:hypothetical protein